MREIPEELINRLKEAKKVAVLTGAGISAESGVPTFRGKEGLWSKFRPEELATVDAFLDNPKLVWEWYQYRRDIVDQVEPNPGHYALVEMEKYYPEFALITQNVDGLHRRAGSRNIYELHGNIMLSKCFDCGKTFDGDFDVKSGDIPHCECGGKIRPDVVWFGELLPAAVLNGAFQAAEAADLFLSIGTSALVHPAASLPFIARRNDACVVEVNLDPTPLTAEADFSLPGKAGEILPVLVEGLTG